MSKKNTYTSKDVQLLNDRDHVRIRIPMYLGPTVLTDYEIPIFGVDGGIDIKSVSFIPATLRAFHEVIDNSVDELKQVQQKNKKLIVDYDPITHIFKISDNGRGIPIDNHPDVNKSTPEVVFTYLRAGRNFDDGNREAGTRGLNGMGVSLTNYVSEYLKTVIVRDGKKYTQTYRNGGADVSKAKIISSSTTKTGTLVEFKLDATLFDTIDLDIDLVYQCCNYVAILNPQIKVVFNGTTIHPKTFKDICGSNFTKFSTDHIDVHIVQNYIPDQVETFSWVNSGYLFDGGLCNTQVVNSFCTRVIDALSTRAKKAKCVINNSDVNNGLCFIVNLRLSNPSYESQAKTKLIGPSLRDEFNNLFNQQIDKFLNTNKQWATDIVDRAVIRCTRAERKTRLKQHKKNMSKKVVSLIDATGKDRMKCTLYITEGLSARAKISEVRDPETIGSYPLTGKINNTYGSTTAQLLNMGKITELLLVIGLTPGQKALRSELNYGQIVIATDADVDGGNIMSLLVNMLYQYWPELFDPNYQPFVYRMVAPNVVASKGNKRIHFTTLSEFKNKQGKYKNYTIEYMKGLGSMVKDDWELCLNKSDQLIAILDDGKMGSILKLLFSNDSDARKTWLTNGENKE